MAGKDNLIPQNMRTKEEQREIAKKGGIASGKARAEKKKMSDIYAKFLADAHEVEIDGKITKIEGNKLLAAVVMKILNRGDSASVAIMKEIRESTEGSKVKIEVNSFSDWVKKVNEDPEEE